MSISDLQALGAFVPVKPIKRTIECDKPILLPEDEWADPEVPEVTGDAERVAVDVYLKRLSSADEIAIAQSDPDDRPFVMVFRLVRNEDGSPLFESAEQAAAWRRGSCCPSCRRSNASRASAQKSPLPRRHVLDRSRPRLRGEKPGRVARSNN